jgi:predicted N-acetyltransferase YhbS
MKSGDLRSPIAAVSGGSGSASRLAKPANQDHHEPMLIRIFRPADMPVARDLLRQLGYDVIAAELDARIERVLAATNHYAAVAEDGGRVVGLVHVFERPALEKPCEAVVQAIVVDDTMRGRGIGKAMMDAAESWAKSRGLGSVVLSTRNASTFYSRLGYGKVATSDLMRKAI